MDTFKALTSRRTVRSFAQNPVAKDDLLRLVKAARLAPSAANTQSLEYVIITEEPRLGEIFDCLKWAAYIAPRGNPAPDKRPTAYIAVVLRADYKPPVTQAYDVGAAIQSICTGAVALSLGSCWLKAINYPRASKIMNLPEGVTLDSIVALGFPDETPQVVDLEPGQSGLEVIKYWRDDDGRHFVPKRAMEDLVHWEGYEE